MGFFHAANEVMVMQSKSKKPCTYPGCPNLTYDTYCEEHQALRHKQYDKYELGRFFKFKGIEKISKKWYNLADINLLKKIMAKGVF